MNTEVGLEKLDGVRMEYFSIRDDVRGNTSKIQVPFSNLEDSTSITFLNSHNLLSGTIRGFHLQTRPYGEEKLISCKMGSIFDVIIDLRAQSKTFGEWASLTLEEGDNCSLFLPAGLAHGYQTTRDNTVVNYLINGRYSPEHAVSFSPLHSIPTLSWPLEISAVSPHDRHAPRLNLEIHKYI